MGILAWFIMLLLLHLLAGIHYNETNLEFGDPSRARQCLSIDIPDDNVVEKDEEFQLELVSNSLHVQLGESTATVVIMDNDGGNICSVLYSLHTVIRATLSKSHSYIHCTVV